MSDYKPKREKDWWEYYPLHKWWCNDLCPLVPRWTYRKGDEWNANNWSVHWLFFHVWSMEHFSLSIDAHISPDDIYVGACLPYLRIIVGIRHTFYRWQMWLCDILRRKPVVKRNKDERTN